VSPVIGRSSIADSRRREQSTRDATPGIAIAIVTRIGLLSRPDAAHQPTGTNTRARISSMLTTGPQTVTHRL